MTDRRRAVLAVVLVFGLSLAGGHTYAAFTDEEAVSVTVNASALGGSGGPNGGPLALGEESGGESTPVTAPTPTPTPTPEPSGTDTDTETTNTDTDTDTETTNTDTDSPTPTNSPTPISESPDGGEQTTEPG